MNIVLAIAVLGAIAVIFGLILAIAAKVFEVKVDERLPLIQACLAGANCGGCGFPGCGGCAEAILNGKAPVTACAPAGAEGAAKIAEILGMEAPSGDKMVAHVMCNGGCNTKKNFEYRGVTDCIAATKVCGGDAMACTFGCFGFGSCAAACKFDAIHVIDGVAVVDKEKCTNCGACREACPRKLIKEVPYKQKVFVNCSNKEKGPAAMKICDASCIGCGVCQRTCKFDAIHVVDNLATIDYSKCKNCTMCAKACPHNAIEPIPTKEEWEKFKAAQKAAADRAAAAKKAEEETAEKKTETKVVPEKAAAAAKTVTEKAPAAKKAAAEKATTAKKAAAEKATTAKKSAAEKATTAKKAAAEKATTAKKAVAEKATTAKKAAAEKATTAKKAAAEKAPAAKKAAAEKATTAKKAAAEKATTAKKAAAEKATTAKKAVAEKATTAKKAVAEKAPAAKKAPAKKTVKKAEKE